MAMRTVSETATVELPMRLKFSNCSELSGKIRQKLAQGNKHIVLDARHMKIIDSNGIGVIAKWFMDIRRLGGTMKVINLNELPLQIFQQSRLMAYCGM